MPHVPAVASVVLLVFVAAARPAAEKDNAPGKRITGTLDAGGVKIWYSVQGQGEPVVLIHGLLASGWLNWDLPGITAALAREHQVITLDVRGHGQSDKPTKDEAYGPELVEDVVRILDHLHVKKAHIVGYSMGGIIGAKFLARHPARALSGTLGGMGWLRQGSPAQRFFAQMGKDGKNHPAGICGRSLARLALTEDEVKSIRVPVAVLVGDGDGLIKTLYVEPLRKLRPDWRVTEIRGADHITCILRPQFRDEIAAWLRKNARPAVR
jgi:pimeloyl-ACP methyl ester carboxylesterase